MARHDRALRFPSPSVSDEHAGSEPGYPEDRHVPLRRPLLGLVPAAAAYGVFQVLARSPQLSEVVLGGGLGTLPARFIAALTGALPFSVAEVAAALYLLWLVAVAGLALRSVIRRRRRLRNATVGGLARMVRDAGILIAAGYLVWGFNYARLPVDVRAGWPAWTGTTVEELEPLARQAVQHTNQAYRTIHGSGDAGAPTHVKRPPNGVAEAGDEGWARVGTLLPQDAPALAGGFGRVKRPWISGVLARLGISGVFMPLTAEPHVLRGLPAVAASQAMAHEQAHQRGFANEAEASFMGFLANTSSMDPVARYSSSVFATRQLLAALGRTDPSLVRDVAAELHPGISRDLVDLQTFWEPYRGVGQKVGSAVNDRYLRANRVEGGVASYGRSVRLLVELHRQTGTLFPTSR